jgi:hypothetical protein
VLGEDDYLLLCVHYPTISYIEAANPLSEEILMNSDRRRSQRFPVGFQIQQIVDDEPRDCFLTDLSSIGLYAERMVEPFERNSNIVQVELPLPDTGDSLWAKGEIVYDCIDPLFHGSAIRFTAMARKHQRMLREWLRESRRLCVRAEQYPFRPEAQATVHGMVRDWLRKSRNRGMKVNPYPFRPQPQVSIVRPGERLPVAA